jgi:carnitine 3-dehydrogenase
VVEAMTVLPSWIDHNGHMTEGRYLLAGSLVSDALLGRIGAGAAYVAGGRSYYTAETHIRHLGEAKAGDRLTGTARVLAHDDKRLHLWISVMREDQGTQERREIATIEQMLLHVDMAAGPPAPRPRTFRRASPPWRRLTRARHGPTAPGAMSASARPRHEDRRRLPPRGRRDARHGDHPRRRDPPVGPRLDAR